MFIRKAESAVQHLPMFPAVIIMGPRQSGKATLAQSCFPNHEFISLEKRTERTLDQTDPERFFRIHDNEHGIILHEFHHAPDILSHIKYLIDRKIKKPGYFILTSSENYLTNRKIRESLAGRTAIVKLMPLSLEELSMNKLIDISTPVEEVIFNGGYPLIYEEGLSANNYYAKYVTRFMDKVARKVKEENLPKFEKFLALCAGTIGQVLTISSFVDTLGISDETVKKWLKILTDNFIVFKLHVLLKDHDRRLTKKPKLYFYDTGLACELLGITKPHEVFTHYLYGSLFENLIMSDLHKQYLNDGAKALLNFWKIRNHEVDCVLTERMKLIPIEFKAAKSINEALFRGLKTYNRSIDSDPELNYLVYGGSENQEHAAGRIVGWQSAGTLVSAIGERISEYEELRHA